MKNSFLYFTILFFLIFSLKLKAQEIEINSSKIQYDNIDKITIFEGNVSSSDEKGNKLFSEYAKYNKLQEVIETRGDTKIITSKGYKVFSSDVVFDNKKNLIYSNRKTKIIDKDGNNILVEMFSYSIQTNIFFSKGNIDIEDIYNNSYNFSEIYIDENKKKIIGSDVKGFLDQIEVTPDNDPRFFANTMSLSGTTNTFEKGIFTYCKNKGDEKCPPWTLQSKKIKHDLAKKTIYYDDVVLKVYDFPIFFFPKFSHPDPTVKRRSGLLLPSLTYSSTLGSGFGVPYFLDIAMDKDLTLTPKIYLNENPLFLAEYRQDFFNSFLQVDAGYSQGFKKNKNKKKKSRLNHFFSNLLVNLVDENEKKSSIEVNIEKVTNDSYLKKYDLRTSLTDRNKTVLENKIDFLFQNKDFFFGLTPSVYEDTNKIGNQRHEYLLPLTLEKNLMTSQRYGYLDLGSNLTIKNYEEFWAPTKGKINKQTNFLINNFKWQSQKWLNSFGIENYFEGLLKTVNYKADKSNEYKNEKDNSEAHAALGYFAKLGMYKEDLINNNFYSLTPKILLRYAPGHMRKVEKNKLDIGNVFSLNKIDEPDIVEPGFSTSVGFEYKKNKLKDSSIIGEEKFSLSVGQVISAKENMDIPSSSSLDQHFSDIVGETKYNIKDRANLIYNFSIDQGYNKINKNEVGGDITFDKAKFNLSYLQERNHIGSQEYGETGVDFKLNSSEISFNTRRNFKTDSAEFYNLSYKYINDCLKAGVAYRREFYTDKDLKAENRLMFTISIIPFGDIANSN
jgi:LPS-assembly protein